MKIAVVGAGWAGMAAALAATQAGHHAIVFEAARAVGGRARALNSTLSDGTPVVLDNGQHILIGAYSQTLELMKRVGVDASQALLRLPLDLRFPDNKGLALPDWPSPLDALGGMLMARGWTLSDKWSLLRAATGWQLQRFQCAPQTSVAQLCAGLTPRVLQTLIEPLCVSALNTPTRRASGQVFLTVLRDSLFGGRGSSNLLLPRVDLSALFPQAAAEWLQHHGGDVRLGVRVDGLRVGLQWNGLRKPGDTPQWQVQGESFDRVIWATSSSNAAQALAEAAQSAPDSIASSMRQWAGCAESLQFEAIATVYAWGQNARLRQPMLSLYSQASTASTGSAAPAQFVFDRGQLGGPPGLLAFVVSASSDTKEVLQAQVLQQARTQLGLALEPVQTVVEKRATFACIPALVRPAMHIAPGLLACGDYIEGPYPATLEGAVRSGWAAGSG